jgi:hypothetical protein
MTIIINCDFCKNELSEKEKKSEHRLFFGNHIGYASNLKTAETIDVEHVCSSCFKTIFKGLHSIIKEMTK